MKNNLSSIKIIKEDKHKKNINLNKKLKVTSENGLRPMTSIQGTRGNLEGKDKYPQHASRQTNLQSIQLKDQSQGNKSRIIKNVKEHNSISSSNLNAAAKKQSNLCNMIIYSKKAHHKSEDNLLKTISKINTLPDKQNLAAKKTEDINEIISQMKVKCRPVSSSDVAVNQMKVNDDASREKIISKISKESSSLFNLMHSMKAQPDERKDEFIKNKYKNLVEDYGIRNEY